MAAEDDSGGRKPRVRLLDAKELLQHGLKILASRALSAGEVRVRLQRKAQIPADVDSVLAQLREHGFLNDERFAEHYALARRDTQGFGKIRVLRDLRQRRVAPAVAGGAVEQVFAGTDEEELVKNFLVRKHRNVDLHAYLQDPKHLQSAFRKLRYAGFGASPAIKVLKRYASAAEELEDDAEPEADLSA